MSLALSAHELKIVHDVLGSHLPRNFTVTIFGSRARGASKPFSDLDIAVKGLESLTLSQHADLAEAFSESDLPFKVDVVDWFSAPPFLQQIIERDGVSLPP